jgi:hypothetical protein
VGGHHGFLAASVAQAFAPGIDRIEGEGFGSVMARTATAAVIGGTAGYLGGGSFVNGAVTGAFGRLFNDEAHRWYQRKVAVESLENIRLSGIKIKSDDGKYQILMPSEVLGEGANIAWGHIKDLGPDLMKGIAKGVAGAMAPVGQGSEQFLTVELQFSADVTYSVEYRLLGFSYTRSGLVKTVTSDWSSSPGVLSPGHYVVFQDAGNPKSWVRPVTLAYNRANSQFDEAYFESLMKNE